MIAANIIQIGGSAKQKIKIILSFKIKHYQPLLLSFSLIIDLLLFINLL